MSYQVRVRPRSEREVLIKQRWENSNEQEKIYDFRGGPFSLKVISLPIDVLVYRMENCRTFSAQQSEIATGDLPKNFFEKGQESSTAQQRQHQILLKLAKQGTSSVVPIIDVLRQEEQRDTILITYTGIVVNGNRRLSAMRELYRNNDGSVNERFSHVRCAVLPPDTTRDEVDDIEADLQAKQETKLDYDWIGDARLVRRQVNKGRTTKEVADRLRRSKADVEKVLQALEEADLYLNEWVKKPGQYDLVAAEGQQIFGDIPKSIAKKDPSLQNASRAIAFSLFENRDRVSGRVYNLNPSFGKLAPKVLELLQAQLAIDNNSADLDEDVEDDFAIDIENEEDNLNYSSIIEALRNESTKEEAVSALIESCETAIELDKDQQSEKAALKALSQAHTKLAGIDITLAGDDTLRAMLKQIESIRTILERVEESIKKRQ
ncbi:MAG: hypothetical protein F4X55_03935 [Candidatus Dadabacteria bacterium]|nr:hypothetical protein [Candidatus Dadabacteria bacterium]MYC40147.1 hypothetical protein [Candidatus Dadabacteria bacterium]